MATAFSAMGEWVKRAGRRVSGRTSQLQRLEDKLAVLQPRLEDRYAQTEGTAAEKAILAFACWLLGEAAAASNSFQGNKGWSLVNKAQELEVTVFSREEVDASALWLERELPGDQIGAWRERAANDLLRQMSPRRSSSETGAPGTQPGSTAGAAGAPTDVVLARDRILLQNAWQIRNEGFGYTYQNICLSSERRLYLLGIGSVLLVIVAVLVNKHVAGSHDPLRQPWVALAATVAGMLGAVISAIQRLAVDPTAAFPSQVASFTATLTRPFVGAVAALTVFVAGIGDVIHFPGDNSVALLILAAFGAGFTERLVVYNPPQ